MVMSETTASKLQHQHWRNRLLSVQSSGTLSYGQGRRSRIEQVTVLWADGTRSQTPVDTSAAGLTVIDQP